MYPHLKDPIYNCEIVKLLDDCTKGGIFKQIKKETNNTKLQYSLFNNGSGPSTFKPSYKRRFSNQNMKIKSVIPETR